jgi:putative molybdopterin biosynthesis protein
VARANDLGFIHYQDERYDFVTPKTRGEKSAVKAFAALLGEQQTRTRLAELGFNVDVRIITPSPLGGGPGRG